MPILIHNLSLHFSENSSHLENGYALKEEINDDNLFPDDDVSEDFHFDDKVNDEDDTEDFIIPDRITRKSGKKKKVAPKMMHKCDQCDAKYPTACKFVYNIVLVTYYINLLILPVNAVQNCTMFCLLLINVI